MVIYIFIYLYLFTAGIYKYSFMHFCSQSINSWMSFILWKMWSLFSSYTNFYTLCKLIVFHFFYPIKSTGTLAFCCVLEVLSLWHIIQTRDPKQYNLWQYGRNTLKIKLFSVENLGFSAIETAANSEILNDMNYDVFQKYSKRYPALTGLPQCKEWLVKVGKFVWVHFG